MSEMLYTNKWIEGQLADIAARIEQLERDFVRLAGLLDAMMGRDVEAVEKESGHDAR
jgi:hypothetical protein